MKKKYWDTQKSDKEQEQIKELNKIIEEHINKDNDNESFSILLPPPNVTGKLHFGHVLDTMFPDTLIKYKLINGYKTLWMPGIDHAGIATQAKLERKLLAEENITRFDLGREKFIEKAFEWKKQYAYEIKRQWKSLGLSLNYDDLKFTLEDDVNKKWVLETFENLYKNEYIYEAKKIVNWDPYLKTAISDIEVENKPNNGKIYYVKYLSESKNEEIIVATTRPETIFGDTALIANPNDERYSKFKGLKFINPLTNELIPLLFDEYVDMEFGTGAMKVTPSHDFNDFELGKKHNLKFINIFNIDGSFNENAGILKNTKYEDIREKTLKLLDSLNAFVKEEDYKNTIPTSQRSGSLVEPYVSKQWFIKTSDIAKKILDKGYIDEMEFYPYSMKKQLIRWLENMDDWCISRQLWWGHRLPVYKNGNKWDLKDNIPNFDPNINLQHPDVMDTWFSSGLWPLVFKDKTYRQGNNYLSDIMYTGSDILLFWVARMIMLTYINFEIKNEILPIEKQTPPKMPFKKVILHGMVNDKQGRKMSKSLDNGIDPLEAIKEFGSDSIRMYLLSSSKIGHNIKYDESKINENSRFLIKLDNIIEFIDKICFKSLDIKDIRELEDFKINDNDDYYDPDYEFLISGLKIELNKLEQEINLLINNANTTLIYKKLNDFLFNVLSSIIINSFRQCENKYYVSQLVYLIKYFFKILFPFIPLKIYELHKRISKIDKRYFISHYINIKLTMNKENYDLEYTYWDFYKFLIYAQNKANTYIEKNNDLSDYYLPLLPNIYVNSKKIDWNLQINDGKNIMKNKRDRSYMEIYKSLLGRLNIVKTKSNMLDLESEEDVEKKLQIKHNEPKMRYVCSPDNLYYDINNLKYFISLDIHQLNTPLLKMWKNWKDGYYSKLKEINKELLVIAKKVNNEYFKTNNFEEWEIWNTKMSNYMILKKKILDSIEIIEFNLKIKQNEKRN